MSRKQVLVFDVYGYMAHFRRFYSNVTSLTYYFPPRNTLSGLMACVLGIPRDGHYGRFSRDRSDIGLAVLTPLRKLRFSVNILDTDQISYKKFRGISDESGPGRVPTVTEFVLPAPPYTRLRYRVFVTHEDSELLEELHNRLLMRRYAIQPALGPAYCLADLEHVYYGEFELQDSDGEEFPIGTVIRQDLVAEQGISPTEGVKIVLEERLPPDFTEKRQPMGPSYNYLLEVSGKPIRVRIRGRVFAVKLEGRNFYGVFM
ncbi:MAG: CRISPR-associated protein Cas5 [Nitrososphaerota archaeon]